jgi:transcriptional regulator with XRE-family HTH domain
MKSNPQYIHYGSNVRRLRYLLGIKQETIAEEIKMTQQNFSKLEQKEEIDDVTLEKIAKVMKISPEVIRNFNEDGVINIILNSAFE